MAWQPLASSFINVSREHRVFHGKDSIFRSYEHCLELMRNGVLDKDTRNAVGQCFGSVILNFRRAGVPFDFSGPWSALLSQWMALWPYSLFECFTQVSPTDCIMFWMVLRQALLQATVNFDFFINSFQRYQRDDALRRYLSVKKIWTELEEASRWSPLRRAWIQAVAGSRW